jgi:hypothetical protein
MRCIVKSNNASTQKTDSAFLSGLAYFIRSPSLVLLAIELPARGLGLRTRSDRAARAFASGRVSVRLRRVWYASGCFLSFRVPVRDDVASRE